MQLHPRREHSSDTGILFPGVDFYVGSFGFEVTFYISEHPVLMVREAMLGLDMLNLVQHVSACDVVALCVSLESVTGSEQGKTHDATDC